MSGESNLDVLLQSLNPWLDPEEYAFCTIGDSDPPPGVQAIFTFHEAEGVTLVAKRVDVERAGLRTAFPCKRIVLTVHSSLDAIGLLAVITTAMARAGIAVNAVSAFHHDHLFVPVARDREALAIIEALTEAPSAGSAAER